jgi:hypothetical protein
MDQILAEYQQRVKARLFNVADQYTISIPPPPPQPLPPVPNGMCTPPAGVPPRGITEPSKRSLLVYKSAHAGSPRPLTTSPAEPPPSTAWLSILSYILVVAIVAVVIAVLYFFFSMQWE